MVAPHYMKSIEKESIIHYQIGDIKYFAEKDRFKVRLASFFKGWPEIKISINYHDLKALRIAIAYVDDVDYRLTSANATYVENVTKEVTDKIREMLEENNHGKDKKPKRISIF